MPLFQRPASSPEEVARSAPLEIPPDVVADMDEETWRARAFRGEAAQLTVRAVVTGSALGFLLAFTNVYVSLKTGWALGVALTACLASFTLWSVLAKAGLVKTPLSILETNCMQSTASSAGYTTSVTAATAIPAMLLLSATDADPRGANPPWWIVAPWMLCVAALGVFLAVPMKRILIDRERLRFPSGTAAAVLLQGLYREGAEALSRGRALLAAFFFASLVPVVESLRVLRSTSPGGGARRVAIWPGPSRVFDFLPALPARTLDAATHCLVDRGVRLSELGVSLDHGVVLVGAGAIVGLRTSAAMVAGGLMVALGLGPVALSSPWTNSAGVLAAAAKSPGTVWRDVGTWFGAPLLLAYGLLLFALQLRTMRGALASMARGATAAGDAATGAEVPMRWFFAGTSVAGAAIVLLGAFAFGIPLVYGVLAVILSFVLALVACRVTGEADLAPVGPLGKITQLTYGVAMPQNTAANLMTASITAGTGLAASDLLNDLKAGRLLGAHPRRQFVAQLLGIFTGTAATCLGYYALVPDATALTGSADHPAAFPAPAAQQWRLVAQVLASGLDALHPLARTGIVVGLVAGALLAGAERLGPRAKAWLPSATGLGLGMILPVSTSLSFLLGALAAWALGRASRARADRYVIPVASGLIAGESVAGVLVAIANNFFLS